MLPTKAIERTPTALRSVAALTVIVQSPDDGAGMLQGAPHGCEVSGLGAPMSHQSGGLAVFDLDGTLLRGPTVCEVLAQTLGRLDQMRQLEVLISGLSDVTIMAARKEMVRWYREVSPADLVSRLGLVTLAPRATAGITLLQRHGVAVAIASITWEFVVAWFARQLRVDYYVGTRLDPDGTIRHFWPRDKVTWLQGLRDMLQIPASRVAAVGDSGGDVEMLRAVKVPLFVGATRPGGLPEVTHLPGADIVTVAQCIIQKFTFEA